MTTSVLLLLISFGQDSYSKKLKIPPSVKPSSSPIVDQPNLPQELE
jgi:hypothetical protein